MCQANAVVRPFEITFSLTGSRRLSAKEKLAWENRRAGECEVFREVFGNPYRPPIVEKATRLAWSDTTVTKFAQVVYEQRQFSDFPVLADALEEAGCGNVAVLDHCRQPGEHVLGCWGLDLLLGKG